MSEDIFVDEREVRAWREMTPAQKAERIVALCKADRQRAFAQMWATYPNASEREIFLRVAIQNLGLDLARQAYPDIDRL